MLQAFTARVKSAHLSIMLQAFKFLKVLGLEKPKWLPKFGNGSDQVRRRTRCIDDTDYDESNI